MALLLSGCSPQQWDPDVATVVETPDVVWEDGPPAGDLEADESVVAARAAMIGVALAQNHHDYTISQLTDHVSPEYIVWLYESDIDQLSNGQPEVNPGPMPSVALETTDTARGVDVVFCGSIADWIVSESNPESSLNTEDTFELTYSMEKDDDGSLVLVDLDFYGTDCDLSTAAVGRFSPEPELPEDVPVDSVRPPIGYEAE